VPDADAIAIHSGAALAEGRHYLPGIVPNPMCALSVLKQAVQAERGIAAQYLLAFPPGESVTLTARISIRAAALQQIRAAD